MSEPRDYGRFPDTRAGDREYVRFRGQQLAEREAQGVFDLRARLESAVAALKVCEERATPPEWVTKDRKQLLFHMADIRAAARAALGAAGERSEE